MTPELREATRLWTLAVPTVSAFITSLVRSFQDRDDLLQETAIAVIEHFERYDPAQPFIGWAIGIARNQVRLHWRKIGRERLAFDTEAIEMLTQAFTTTHTASEQLEYLGECIDALDDRAREICRLRYEEDRKPIAIAARLGLEANTVAKALQRIRERLRDCIERKAREVLR